MDFETYAPESAIFLFPRPIRSIKMWIIWIEKKKGKKETSKLRQNVAHCRRALDVSLTYEITHSISDEQTHLLRNGLIWIYAENWIENKRKNVKLCVRDENIYQNVHWRDLKLRFSPFCRCSGWPNKSRLAMCRRNLFEFWNGCLFLCFTRCRV